MKEEALMLVFFYKNNIYELIINVWSLIVSLEEVIVETFVKEEGKLTPGTDAGVKS